MDKKLIGISNKVQKYRHIHMLNGYKFPADKSTVFKYMPLERLVQSVKDKALVFVSPEAWYDPFEQLYYGIDCSARDYNTEDIACMCVSEKSSTNEDASWRVYAGSSDKSVRVSFEQEALMGVLDEFADNNGYEVYIGKVDYSFEKKEIKDIYKSSSSLHHIYFPYQMSREHYLSLMLLKRKAFQYENEVRIFLVKNKIPFKNNLLSIPCDYLSDQQPKLISNLMLSPYPPVRPEHDLANKVREKINKMESDQIKEELNKMLDCRIQQSMLYKVYPRVKRI